MTIFRGSGAVCGIPIHNFYLDITQSGLNRDLGVYAESTSRYGKTFLGMSVRLRRRGGASLCPLCQ
jgi:hypothetical protein